MTLTNEKRRAVAVSIENFHSAKLLVERALADCDFVLASVGEQQRGALEDLAQQRQEVAALWESLPQLIIASKGAEYYAQDIKKATRDPIFFSSDELRSAEILYTAEDVQRAANNIQQKVEALYESLTDAYRDAVHFRCGQGGEDTARYEPLFDSLAQKRGKWSELMDIRPFSRRDGLTFTSAVTVAFCAAFTLLGGRVLPGFADDAALMALGGLLGFVASGAVRQAAPFTALQVGRYLNEKLPELWNGSEEYQKLKNEEKAKRSEEKAKRGRKQPQITVKWDGVDGEMPDGALHGFVEDDSTVSVEDLLRRQNRDDDRHIGR